MKTVDAQSPCIYNVQSPCALLGHIFFGRHLELKVQGPGMWTCLILSEITKNTLKQLQFTFLPMYKEHVRVGHILTSTSLSDF